MKKVIRTKKFKINETPYVLFLNKQTQGISLMQCGTGPCKSMSAIICLTDVDKLAARIEDEVARKKDSVGLVQILHRVLE